MSIVNPIEADGVRWLRHGFPAGALFASLKHRPDRGKGYITPVKEKSMIELQAIQ